MKWLQRLFPSLSAPGLSPQSAKDWGYLIYARVIRLYQVPYGSRKYRDAEKSIKQRGLAFGSIQILSGQSNVVKFCAIAPPIRTRKEVEEALNKALQEQNFADAVSLVPGFASIGIEAITKKSTPPLPGRTWCSVNASGHSISRTVFFTVHHTDKYGIGEMEAPSPEAMGVLMRTLEILGVTAGAVHYAHESNIPIEDIVISAARWEDPDTGCRYLDVLTRPPFVKHKVWHGAYRSAEMKEKHLLREVYAAMPGSNWWPKISINNRPVYSTIVKRPTQGMLAAREKFAAEAIRRCRVCKEIAIHEITLVKFQMGDSEMGGIDYACGNEAHVLEISQGPSIRSTVRKYTQEVWIKTA